MYYFFTDLDNTLIYSERKILGERVCVEYKEGKELSFMTVFGYEKYLRLVESIVTVPITTRSLEQYRRITLFHENIPRIALVSNGGILLRDGEVDQEWLDETKKTIEGSYEEINKAKLILENRGELAYDIRNIDGLFLFTKSHNTDLTYEALKKDLDESKVLIEINLSKVYVLPIALTKGLAIKRLRKLDKNEKIHIIAAGDSTFDIPMLCEADTAIGYHGEITEERVISKKYDFKRYIWKGEALGFSEFVLDKVIDLVRSRA